MFALRSLCADKARKDKKHKKGKRGESDEDDGGLSSDLSAPTARSTTQQKPPDLRAPATLPSPTATAPAVSPTAMSASASASGAKLVQACLVELYEMVKGKAKGYGPKGLALVRSIDNAYTLLLYAPNTTKHEQVVPLTHDMDWLTLPDRWATFSDNAGRNWSVRFTAADDATNFARSFACCKDDMSAFDSVRGGSRRLIVQDLAIGTGDLSVEAGDHVKIKYSVYLTAATHPTGMGERLTSKESKRFTVGSGSMSMAIEQGLIGMKKKGLRFLVIPAAMMADAEAMDFGPHVPANSTLLVEVTVTSVHSDRVVENVELNAPELDVLSDRDRDRDSREDEPPIAASGAGDSHLSLKDRMKHLALAAAAPAISAPVLASHPHPAASSPSPATHTTQHRAPSPATSTGVWDAELERLLDELQMTEFLPNFRHEGIRYADLRLVVDDADEMKVLVPQMGPRRRLISRLAEMKEGKGAASSGRENGAERVHVHAHSKEKDERHSREEREREERDRERERERETRERDIREREEREARDREILRERELRERERERDREREQERERERERDRSHHNHHAHQHSHSHDSAAASSAANRSVSTLRSRFDYHGDDTLPVPSPHNSSTHPHQPADYSRGVHDGKEEMARIAREKLDAMKESATQRFNALQDELEEAKRGREDDVRRAKEVIAQLRAEVKEAREGREELVERSRQYVEKMRGRAEEEGKEKEVALLRGAMDAVYQRMREGLEEKQLYEGHVVLEMIRKALKQVTAHALQQQQQQQQQQSERSQ